MDFHGPSGFSRTARCERATLRNLLVLVVVLFFEPSLVHVGMGVCAVAMVVLMVMLGMLVAVLTMGVRMRGTLMLVLVSVTLSMVVI